MILRAVVLRVGLMLLAIANGTLREFVLTPRLRDKIGRILSTLLLSVLILLVAWLLTPWIGTREAPDAWKVALWLALTLGFEFIVGHYIFGNSWPKLLPDYDIFHGRIWVMVPLITLMAPKLAIAAHW